MKTSHNRRTHALLVAALALATLAEATDAYAIIGRPLTPMSYAGVARRTTRRAYYGPGANIPGSGAYRYGVYGGAVGVRPPVPYVAALPGGCGPFVGGYYTCGAVRYAPVYSSGTVVYTVVR